MTSNKSHIVCIHVCSVDCSIHQPGSVIPTKQEAIYS